MAVLQTGFHRLAPIRTGVATNVDRAQTAAASPTEWDRILYRFFATSAFTCTVLTIGLLIALLLDWSY